MPAIGVMTTRFVSAAELMCRVLGMPDYPFVVIDHPISSASDERLAHCHNVPAPLRQNVAEAIEPSILDVGGGSGLYTIAWLERHPGLHAIVWDRPEVLKVASELVAAHGVADRLETVAGDMNDAVLDAENLARIVLFSVLEPGGQTGEVLAVEQLDRFFWRDRLLGRGEAGEQNCRDRGPARVHDVPPLDGDHRNRLAHQWEAFFG